MVATVTKLNFYNLFLLILIVLDQTVILVYYMTFYVHSLMHSTSKPLKNG